MNFTPHPRWSLTREALERLLSRMGPDPEAAAREYETLRTRLLEFFDARHACSPETLADETLDRVARKLDEGESVRNLRAYLYGVARRVALEAEKLRAREWAASRDLRALPAREPPELVEARVDCLERCLRELPAESRELIVGYYDDTGVAPLERRRRLADQLGITYTALKTRAHRIRTRLEACLQTCLQERNSGAIQPARPSSIQGARSDEL
jgi:DNA-directed RNA polymerase specialized sigma24 family protein